MSWRNALTVRYEFLLTKPINKNANTQDWQETRRKITADWSTLFSTIYNLKPMLNTFGLFLIVIWRLEAKSLTSISIQNHGKTCNIDKGWLNRIIFAQFQDFLHVDIEQEIVTALRFEGLSRTIWKYDAENDNYE